MTSSSHDHEYPNQLAASAGEQGANRRVDPAHRVRRDQDQHTAAGDTVSGDKMAGDEVSGSVASDPDTAAADVAAVTDPVVALLGQGPHVHLHAEQLARLLADRLSEIDRREAQLHVLAADLDNQQRTARLSLVEREQELDRREAFLAKLETSAGHVDDRRVRAHAHDHSRLDRFLRADASWNAEPDDPAHDDDAAFEDVAAIEDSTTLAGDEPASASVDNSNRHDAELTARQQRLDAIRDTLVAEHRRLIDSRHTLEDWARRRRDEIERQAAELAVKQQTVERQTAENDRWRAERATCYAELERLRRGQRRRTEPA